MALEPLVNGLIGDTQVGVAAEPGYDAWDTEVAYPLPELCLPSVRDSFEAPPGEGLLSERRLVLGSGPAMPFVRSRAKACCV